jgi:XTP/dITP diphosphohydrolase
MPDITFVTGNDEKFHIASLVFAEHNINLQQARIDIDEIQGEDAERIVRDKLQKAYAALQKPVVVNDDSWAFMGLGGFPGPYMKSINHWFTPEDFLRLTLPLEDRRVVLTQWIGYQDADTQKLFKLEHSGEILKELRGNHGSGLQQIITMPGDNGLSVSEQYDRGADMSGREVTIGWRQCIDWYKREKS